MLQFITHYTDSISYLDSVRLALAGGCRWVQLRMKNVQPENIKPVAAEALRMCREAGATFIIDDHVNLAKEVGADGVHLGRNDMPVDQARAILGPDFIIGGTANTVDDIITHWNRGADYIGCGPFRFTTTKEKLSPVLGLDGYRNIIAGMRQHGIDLPIVAIGGITAEDIPAILSTGVTGIALSGSVLRASDPAAEMRRILGIIETSKTQQ